MAYVIGIIVPYGFGIGNGLELIAIPVGMGLGVWIPAYFIKKVYWKSLVGSILGAGILMMLVNYVLPPMGFGALLLPLLGSFSGYYLALKFTKQN